MTNCYTVSEYAKIMNKDPGNIRRMLIKGIIKGEKLGKQWVIPAGTVYPEDGRIKTGKYGNWRKRSLVNQSNPGLMNALTQMSASLSKIYGSRLERVVLYGSYARGEQGTESDVDIAVIIKGNDDEITHNQMVDVVVEYELDLALTLSVVPVEYDNYMEWKNVLPFYKNMTKEGIVIWKAA